MNIGWAVETLRAGYAVTRYGWNGKNQFLTLQTPDSNSKMTMEYVYITTTQDEKVPWLCSTSDLLANDWDFSDYEEDQ